MSLQIDWIQSDYLELIDCQQAADSSDSRLTIGILVYDADCPKRQRVNKVWYDVPDEIAGQKIAGYRLKVTLSQSDDQN
jgi:hypothetical protein